MRVSGQVPIELIARMGGFTCPRDLFFVAGKQVIEAPGPRWCGFAVERFQFGLGLPGTDELAQPLFRALGMEGLADESRPQSLRGGNDERQTQSRRGVCAGLPALGSASWHCLPGYYRSDPRMRWSAAPKPMLLDESFGGDGEARIYFAPRQTHFSQFPCFAI